MAFPNGSTRRMRGTPKYSNESPRNCLHFRRKLGCDFFDTFWLGRPEGTRRGFRISGRIDVEVRFVLSDVFRVGLPASIPLAGIEPKHNEPRIRIDSQFDAVLGDLSNKGVATRRFSRSHGINTFQCPANRAVAFHEKRLVVLDRASITADLFNHLRGVAGFCGQIGIGEVLGLMEDYKGTVAPLLQCRGVKPVVAFCVLSAALR